MAKNKSNSRGLTPEEVKSELALLKNSYDMYEKSKEETEYVMKNRLDKNGNRNNVVKKSISNTFHVSPNCIHILEKLSLGSCINISIMNSI